MCRISALLLLDGGQCLHFSYGVVGLKNQEFRRFFTEKVCYCIHACNPEFQGECKTMATFALSYSSIMQHCLNLEQLLSGCIDCLLYY